MDLRTLLQYPLKTSVILRKKKSIKNQLLKQDIDLVEKKIAILGGSTTSELLGVLELFLLDAGIKPEFYESQYNSFLEDAIFGQRSLDKFDPDVVYIHTSRVNVERYPELSDSESDVEKLLEVEIEKFKSVWSSLDRFKCAIIQNNFDFHHHRALGNLDCYDFRGKTRFLSRLNEKLHHEACHRNNLYINDINYLSAYIGLEKWFDKSLWYHAKYAVSFQAIPILSHNLSQIIAAIFGKSKKCLILDLDNTCWGGVIGDDGLDGIQIGRENARSETYADFQQYAKDLGARGVALAVCSKNEAKNAEEGFSHPDSVLNLDDFVSFKANWEMKAGNIVEILRELNITDESAVFIDDSPYERECVKLSLPGVSVPDVGSDVIDFMDFIDQNRYFEPIAISNDDISRGQYFEENKQRLRESVSFASHSSYLESLKMVAEIEPFSSFYLERITQLTNKTNQFNLTTKRYTFSEIESISNDESFIPLYGKLSDRFGENGLVAVCIGSLNDHTCRIDLWLMSCRVFNRDMEFAMFDEMVRRCKKVGIDEIIGDYYPTSKNVIVEDLYERLGFSCVERGPDGTTWRLDLSNYENKNLFIGVQNAQR